MLDTEKAERARQDPVNDQERDGKATLNPPSPLADALAYAFAINDDPVYTGGTNPSNTSKQRTHISG